MDPPDRQRDRRRDALRFQLCGLAVALLAGRSGADTSATFNYEADCEAISSCSVESGVELVLGSRCHTLSCVLRIRDGGSLVVRAGTTIIATPTSQLDSATAIVVHQGGTIIANGTATAPITFTAATGQLPINLIGQNAIHSGTPVDPAASVPSYSEAFNRQLTLQKGLWGGLVLAGRAPLGGVPGSAITQPVEGIQDTTYGGTDPADSSGVLRHVRIWHPGYVVADGNELNGITLAGVGTGTVVEYVEVALSADDGVELFGGTVNINHLSVVDVADDAVDLDIGYSGTIDTVFVLRRGDTGSAFEFGGCSVCGSDTSSFTVNAATVIDDLYTGSQGLAAIVNQKSPVTRGNVLSMLVCGVADGASGNTTLFGVDCAINGTECAVITTVDPLCNMTSETSSSSISFVDPFGVAAGTATGVTHGAFSGIDADGWLASLSILGETGRLPNSTISATAERLPCGELVADLSLAAGTSWLLKCTLVVPAGRTIAIGAGVTVYAMVEDLSSLLSKAAIAPALIIQQGGRIEANGTSALPITFTSALPMAQLPIRGAWGGLVIAGFAPVANPMAAPVVEGCSADVVYGGEDVTDSSGWLTHVRIWYPGRVASHGVELNGLTLAGVGSGTLIEHVEVAFGLDDGFELFGGTVDLRWVSVVNVRDDAFDFDEGYAGRVQFAYALLGDDSNRAIESTGGVSGGSRRSFPVIRSATFVRMPSRVASGGRAVRASDEFVALEAETGGHISNTVLAGATRQLVTVASCAAIDTWVGMADPGTGVHPGYLWVSPNTLTTTTTTTTAPSVGAVAWGTSDCSTRMPTPTFIRSSSRVLQYETAAATTRANDPRPIPGGAAFNDLDVATGPVDSFFVPTTYKGAFGPGLDDLWLCNLSTLDATVCRTPAVAVEHEGSPSSLSVVIGIVVLSLVVLVAVASALIAQYGFSKQRLHSRKFKLSASIKNPPKSADGGALLTSSIAEIDFGTNTVGFGRRPSNVGVEIGRPEKGRTERHVRHAGSDGAWHRDRGSGHTGSDGTWHRDRGSSPMSPATVATGEGSPTAEDEVFALPSDNHSQESIV